jgi:hypothetical protein
MIKEVWNIRNMVGGEDSLNNVYVDQANTDFIEAVKQDFGENSDGNMFTRQCWNTAQELTR